MVAEIMYIASWKIKGRPSVRFVMFNSKFQFYFIILLPIFFVLSRIWTFDTQRQEKEEKHRAIELKKSLDLNLLEASTVMDKTAK